MIKVTREAVSTGEQVCVMIKYHDISSPNGELATLSEVRREIEVSGVEEDVPLVMRFHWLGARTSGLNENSLALCEYGKDISMGGFITTFHILLLEMLFRGPVFGR